MFELGYTAKIQARQEIRTNITQSAGATAYTFDNTFFTGTAALLGANSNLPSVNITAQNLASGDYFEITNLSGTGEGWQKWTPLETILGHFEDFYNLDTDNFDESQQTLARHLIGYQPRQYLEDLGMDENSQYKFYQGFVREKGTTNALSKMFDALASADKESINFHEEWAIRKGQYGASAVFDEIEYNLDESKVRMNPQPIELTDDLPARSSDLTYRIQSGQLNLKPQVNTHAPFPTKYNKNTSVKTAGPVNPVDINLTVGKYEDLLTADTSALVDNNYVWVGDYNNSWNVFRYSKTTQRIQAINVVNNTIEVDTLNLSLIHI